MCLYTKLHKRDQNCIHSKRCVCVCSCPCSPEEGVGHDLYSVRSTYTYGFILSFKVISPPGNYGNWLAWEHIQELKLLCQVKKNREKRFYFVFVLFRLDINFPSLETHRVTSWLVAPKTSDFRSLKENQQLAHREIQQCQRCSSNDTFTSAHTKGRSQEQELSGRLWSNRHKWSQTKWIV